MTDSIAENLPHNSPLNHVELNLDSEIQFRCHKDIACFNQCCKHIDITLTPYDILRLKTRLKLTSNEFLAAYTAPFEMDGHGMPGVKIKTADDNWACPFLTEKGCGVYEDRPTVCRYYAVGLMSMRRETASTDESTYFLVEEDHCLGHQEDRKITVADFLKEQGVEKYDEMNREWQQLILKKRSAGPTIGKPSKRSFQLFFLGCYNLDNFREFVKSNGFVEVYELSTTELEQLQTDDDALLSFAFKFLKQVLFGENTIAVKQDAIQKRAQRRREQIQADPDDPNKDYNGPEMI